jgi:hypothetical protein
MQKEVNMNLFPRSFISKIEKGEIVDYDELKDSVLGLDKKVQKYSDFKQFLTSIDTSDAPKTRQLLQDALADSKEMEDEERITVLEKLLKMKDEELAQGISEAIGNWAEKTQKPPQFIETVNLFDQEIFAAGDYGKKGKYTVEDLQTIVENSKKLQEKIKPPIKLGHFSAVDTGLPSLGWVENLRVSGDKLISDFKEVPKKIADILRAKGYRRVSAEIYAEPIHGCNPPALRAVALLGSDIPEVKTLEDIQTLYNSEGEPRFDIVNFDEKKGNDDGNDNSKGGKDMDKMDNRLTALEKENITMKVDSFMEKHKTKVLPTYEPILRALLTETYTEERTITFAESDGENKGKEMKVKLGDAIQTLFDRMPDIVKLDEVGKKGDLDPNMGESNMKKIEAYAKEHNCSIEEARTALGIDFTEEA